MRFACLTTPYLKFLGGSCTQSPYVKGLLSEISCFKVCPLRTAPECLRFGCHCVKSRYVSQPPHAGAAAETLMKFV